METTGSDGAEKPTKTDVMTAKGEGVRLLTGSVDEAAITKTAERLDKLKTESREDFLRVHALLEGLIAERTPDAEDSGAQLALVFARPLGLVSVEDDCVTITPLGTRIANILNENPVVDKLEDEEFGE